MTNSSATKQSKLSLFFGSFIPAFLLLRKNDPMRMAGATAFFTTFALPPIVFLLAQLFGFFFTPKMIGRGLIENLAGSLGTAGAEQVRGVIRSIRGFSSSWYVVLFGGLFLVFVATTLFTVIKNSFNQIWGIERDKQRRFRDDLFGRLKSFAVILFVGLLFLGNLLFKSLETESSEFIESFKISSFYFKLIFGEVSSIIVVSLWFIILFRFNSDGRPGWKAAILGGLLTGILFSLGRLILRTLLINGHVGSLYGASGSFVLVLLFVFYTSFILYYGAAFIEVFSEKIGWKNKL